VPRHTRNWSRIGLITCALSIAACSGSPRPDDPSAVRPEPPLGARAWQSISWRPTRFDEPARASAEQWDQAVAVEHGRAGYVAVGSNSDITGYVGRIWLSGDGLDWRLQEGADLNGLELVDIAAGPQAYAAIGTRAGDPNDPVTAILTSTDGAVWREVASIPGAWGTRIAAGPLGSAALVEVAESTEMWFAPDAVTWTRASTDLDGDVMIRDIAGEPDGWIAVGSRGHDAVVFRSSDGLRWTEELLPAGVPVQGIINVMAYRVVPGRWATVVFGLDRGPSCEQGDDWCDKYQATWVWTARNGWSRLPKSSWINDRGHGVEAFAAGDAGFVYVLGDDVRLSADGWDWLPVKGEPSGGLAVDVIVTGDQLVAVGIASEVDEDDPLKGWFGTATFGS
jgi:hypothetical protein